MRLIPLVVAALSLATPLAAETCGGADTPCQTDSGTYHLRLPVADAPGAIVIDLHGGGGTGKGMLKSGFSKAVVARGYLYVAPNGEHPEARWSRDWSVRADNMAHARDDKAFLAEVLADVRARFGLDDAPVLLAGFSRGGSMTWDVACFTPGFADAYAPAAGAFWDALPARCAAPVKLFHTHGWNDRTVPLEGRSFAGGSIVQGDVWAGLKVLRETNGCVNRQPAENTFEDSYWLRHWTDCEAGELRLLMHPGGHGRPKGWSARMLDWFEAVAMDQPG